MNKTPIDKCPRRAFGSRNSQSIEDTKPPQQVQCEIKWRVEIHLDKFIHFDSHVPENDAEHSCAAYTA